MGVAEIINTLGKLTKVEWQTKYPGVTRLSAERGKRRTARGRVGVAIAAGRFALEIERLVKQRPATNPAHRPPVHNAEADAKLAKDWEIARKKGTTQVDFAHQRAGMEIEPFLKLLNRVRNKQRRDAKRQNRRAH